MKKTVKLYLIYMAIALIPVLLSHDPNSEEVGVKTYFEYQQF